MNQLEAALCYSVRRAYSTYKKITGNWLLHAPEHYLQNFILLHLGEKGHDVYAEATRKKIADGSGRPARGRPPTAKAARFDLVVWKKTADELRAVIEIKRCLSLVSAVHNDTKRIKRSLSSSQPAKAGYLVVYSEIKTKSGKDAIISRFGKWAEELDLELLKAEILDLESFGSGWIAGYSLMRA
jgi:hypothetical protein